MYRSSARQLSLAAAAAVLAACGAPAPTPPAPVASYDIADFLDTTNFRGASFSADRSRLLVSSDASGVYNAYALPTDGSAPEPLTDSATDSVFALSYFPADDRFLYSQDQGGNEQTHIHVRELDGSSRDLTPGEPLKAQFAGWSQDDASFYVMTNERDPRFFDLYAYAVDGYERRELYREESGYQVAAVSPDERYVALVQTHTTSNSDVHIHDRQSGTTRLVTAHEGDVSYTPQTFSLDGRELYMTTDEGAEFAYLVAQDVTSGERRTVLRTDWDVLYAGLSKHGRWLTVGINNDARTEVRILDASTLEPVDLPSLPSGEISSVSFADDERHLAFYLSSSRRPRDLFVHDLEAGEPRGLTQSLSEAIAAEDLVEGEVVRFDSYDGVEIPGILYVPRDAAADGSSPALVWVHGGPGGQSRLGYNPLIQYLVNHGYVVYAINNRGSSGYGKTFYQMDDRRHGEADLEDCIASKQMLIDTGYVDAERIGIIGGSYGGYMVLAALAFTPEEFAVGVDIFGVSNWLRTLTSIPDWWESFRQALYKELGDPAEDEERLRRISPLFHAENIVRPLMVLQGANDPRVLQAESDEIVEAARANGVPVEYIVFEDEGHGFLKKENQREGYEAVLQFLDQYLASDAGS